MFVCISLIETLICQNISTEREREIMSFRLKQIINRSLKCHMPELINLKILNTQNVYSVA